MGVWTVLTLVAKFCLSKSWEIAIRSSFMAVLATRLGKNVANSHWRFQVILKLLILGALESKFGQSILLSVTYQSADCILNSDRQKLSKSTFEDLLAFGGTRRIFSSTEKSTESCGGSAVKDPRAWMGVWQFRIPIPAVTTPFGNFSRNAFRLKKYCFITNAKTIRSAERQ